MTNERSPGHKEEEEEVDTNDMRAMFNAIMKSNEGIKAEFRAIKSDILREVGAHTADLTIKMTNLQSETNSKFADLENRTATIAEQSYEAGAEPIKADATRSVPCQNTVKDEEKSFKMYGGHITQSKQEVVDSLIEAVEIDSDFISPPISYFPPYPPISHPKIGI